MKCIQNWQNLVDIFWRPERVGNYIAKRPNVLLPLILITILITLSNFMTIDIKVHDVIMRVPDRENLNLQSLADNFKYLFWSLNSFKLVWVFLVSFALYYLLRLAYDSFSLALSIAIVAHGEFINICGEFLTAIMVFLKNDIHRSFSFAYPALLFGLGPRTTAYQCLSLFNFFFIWEIIAVGIVLSTILGLTKNRGLKISLLVFGGLKVFKLICLRFLWG
jgi:hypothetical protein